jgi:hypothetical protein
MSELFNILAEFVEVIAVNRAVNSEKLVMLYCLRVDEVAGAKVALCFDISVPINSELAR